MSKLLGSNFVHYTKEGLFFYDSSSVLTPSTSQSSQTQITQITCSADFENNIASTGSLSGYFVVPLIGGFPKGIGELTVGEDFAVSTTQKNAIPSQLNVVYNTGSFFAVSSSNENFHYQPTSSQDIINFVLNVSIEKNDSPNLVALKTYNAITGSLIYDGFTDDEGVSVGYNYISASLTGSAITIFNTLSQSIDSVFISGGANLGGIGDFIVGENFTVGYSPFASNIVQSGSYGSGSFINYQAPKGKIVFQSSSLAIGRDIDDKTQSSFIFRVQSGSFGGSSHRDILYVSASEGKIGLGTTDPLTDVDIRADELQIQRKAERRGLKINNEGNIESFSSDLASATTGSEFLLRYSRGIDITPDFMTTFLGLTGDAAGSSSAHAATLFSQLKPDVQSRALSKAEAGGKLRPPDNGDTLGAIRWVSDSGSLSGFDDRTTGETAVIKAIVSDADASGIQADLVFSVAGKSGAAEQKFLIDAGNDHQITGALNILGNIRTSGFIQPRQSENSQTRMDFANSGVDINFYSNTSQVLKLSNTGVVFNELSNDIDFRIESDDDIKAFYIDADINAIQLGSAATTHVTASGNISSSGVLYATGLSETVATTGLTLTGNITASGNISTVGNISASGDLYSGDKLYINSKEALEDTGTTLSINEQGDFTSGVQINRINLPQPLKINGNVTASGNISSSSTIQANNFVDNNTRIKILPRDFVADDVGRPLMIEDDSLGSNTAYLHSLGSANAFAYIDIPFGYTATHTKISGSNTSNNFTTYEGNIGSNAIVTKGSSTAVNTEKDITDVAYSATNYLLIAVTDSGGSTDEIFGGYVTITPS